jgi:hypothetical protein
MTMSSVVADTTEQSNNHFNASNILKGSQLSAAQAIVQAVEQDLFAKHGLLASRAVAPGAQPVSRQENN